MHYREFRPSAPLAPYVECFWVLEGDPTSNQTEPERLLPDGCVELVLNFGAPFRQHLESSVAETQPGRFLAGQLTRPLLISPTGSFQIVGIRFQPGGTVPFFPLSMSELTDRIAALADVASDLERSIVERVGEENSAIDKVRLTSQLLEQHLKRNSKTNTPLQPAVTCMLRSCGQISIDSLAHDLGITGRQLLRRFQFEVGLGPKLLCRILRFQRVFSALEGSDESWASVALDCGYYDQAHLIKEFQQFTGQSPSLLIERLTPFTEQFTRKSREV